MIESFFHESIAVKERILNDHELMELIYTVSEACRAALARGNKIILAGNGGSFADAQHISAEFTSRFMFDRASLASISLGCNSSSMSAIGNDYGFEQAFARELSSIGTAGDIFIPISTSGNSPNILAAIKVAHERGLTTYGLTGYTGGAMMALCTCIKVPSGSTPRIQEAHILIGHSICAYVEEKTFKPHPHHVTSA